ncbi:hypothetical protein ACVWWR_002285 [Bradyrhizobium sp. LM3.2]
MSDLTEVEVLWLEKRIKNRIRFGRIIEENGRLIATDVCCHSRRAASLLSFVGRPMTLERSFRGLTSCARLHRDSAARPYRM